MNDAARPRFAPSADRLIEAGHRICLLRTGLGMTQCDLTERTGIPQTTISYAERGGKMAATGRHRVWIGAAQRHIASALLAVCRDRMARGIIKRPPRFPYAYLDRLEAREILTPQARDRLLTTGNRLRRLRMGLGVTQDAIARVLQTSQTVVSLAERGGAAGSLHPDTLRATQQRIAALLMRWRAEHRRYSTPTSTKVTKPCSDRA